MGIVNFSKFDQYKEDLYALPADYTDEMIRNERFLLDRDEKKQLEIYYAPFEYVNEKAKVVIAGITPGMHQMRVSFSTVIDVKDRTGEKEILHEVKKRSSFEGPMRRNLLKMLDELGLPQHLGIETSAELFTTANHLVHTGSVLNYPVFYKGKNYSGTTPHILKTDLLHRHIMEGFATEIRHIDNPLIIPLGVNVSKVLLDLAEKGLINGDNLLLGFPHPSGGNGHRHRQFAENKAQMQEKMTEYFRQNPI